MPHAHAVQIPCLLAALGTTGVSHQPTKFQISAAQLCIPSANFSFSSRALCGAEDSLSRTRGVPCKVHLERSLSYNVLDLEHLDIFFGISCQGSVLTV